MKTILIEGTPRKQLGKAAAKRLRSSKLIPCNIYGGAEHLHFSAPVSAFKELIYTPEFYTATIRLNGKDHPCIVQEIQFHPVTDEILHVDFRELHPDKKIVVELPVQLQGSPPGAREGGKIHLRMKKLRVRLLPKDLVEHITVDISHLQLGKSVRVGDLQLPNIELLDNASIPIVTVSVPRVAKEEASAAAEPTAATSTEKVTEKK